MKLATVGAVLAVVLSLLALACATVPATSPRTVVPPLPAPVVLIEVPPTIQPVVVPTHPIAHVGAWGDGGQETGAFTTFITVAPGCMDDAAYATAQLDLQRDTRQIVWTANLFTYGPTARSRGGYSLRSDASACWQELRTLIASHLDRTLAVWLLDEPDAVACGDQADTDGIPCGTAGDRDWDPNLYADLVTTACAMIRADWPAVAIGLNYGSVPAGLMPPACLSIVGIEAYRADWKQQLQQLEPLTAAELWLLSPAFTDPPGYADGDAVIADRLREELTYAHTDARVTGLYWFLWCCDDEVTGNKQFHSAGGGHLPLTLAALHVIGHSIRGDASTQTRRSTRVQRSTRTKDVMNESAPR